MKTGAVVAVGAAAALAAGKLTYAATPKIPFDDLFNRKAGKYGVPKRLMVAIVAHESRFDPRAVNLETEADVKKGRDVDSLGLGQILWPDTASDLGIAYREALFDPETNMDGVGFILRRHIRRYGYQSGVFPEDVVSAYNGGHSLRQGTTFANQRYVDKVREKWEEFSGV